jgi:hypothetical protein
VTSQPRSFPYKYRPVPASDAALAVGDITFVVNGKTVKGVVPT